MKHRINVVFEEFSVRRVTIPAIIRLCIRETLKAEGIPVPCEINVLITNNAGIQTVNRESRKIDSPTDVLSFPMFSFMPGKLPNDWAEYTDPGTGLCPLGDMCISLERAQEQAEEFGHSLRREVGYLTIHSVLHLLGYDHMDEGPQKRRMREREEMIAAGIPRMTREERL